MTGCGSERQGENRGGAVTSLTVFYDGGCPMCRREIAHYQHLAGAGAIDWQDIAQSPEVLAAHGLAWTEAMQRLHVCTAVGQCVSGVEAFVEIWQRLPRYRWAARAVRAMPGLLALLEWAYRHFARWRWRRHCADGICTP
jgi:predicted DCC family thiol-disulfide oxidoreductase YuxK